MKSGREDRESKYADQALGALTAAHRRFVAWRDDRNNWPEAPDRLRFSALAKAATELQDCIDSLGQSERRALMCFMQDLRIATQEEHDEQLRALTTALTFVAAAASKGSGRGIQDNHPAHVWVRMAAEEWRSSFGKDPAEKGGRFLKSLQVFQARDVTLPAISEDIAQKAVRHWKQMRR